MSIRKKAVVRQCQNAGKHKHKAVRNRKVLQPKEDMAVQDAFWTVRVAMAALQSLELNLSGEKAIENSTKWL